jgi:hypothetical protein
MRVDATTTQSGSVTTVSSEVACFSELLQGAKIQIDLAPFERRPTALEL